MQVARLRASKRVIQDTPVFQMSYDDPYSMIDLVKSARCIINVAGPYMLTQGELMIDACISMGSLTRFMGQSGQCFLMSVARCLHLSPP